MKTIKIAMLVVLSAFVLESNAQEKTETKEQPKSSRIKNAKPVKKDASENNELKPATKVDTDKKSDAKSVDKTKPTTEPVKKTDSKETSNTNGKMKSTKKPVRKTVVEKGK